MRQLPTFQVFVQKIYESQQTPFQTIILMGLPGSGKSTKAQEIQLQNPDREFVIYDDSESLGALENLGSENQIISDTILTLDPPEGGLDEFKELANQIGVDLKVLYFENDPQRAKINIRSRWESGKAQSHQSLKLLNDVDFISKRYKIPPGTKTIPVYKPGEINEKHGFWENLEFFDKIDVLIEGNDISMIPLTKEQKQEYIQELAKHVTYPDIYEKDPELWQEMVNYGNQIEWTSSSDLPYNLPQLNRMTKDVTRTVWGTSQGDFNKFFGIVTGLDEDHYKEYTDLKNAEVSSYIRRFQKPEEIAIIMKTLYDGGFIFKWISV